MNMCVLQCSDGKTDLKGLCCPTGQVNDYEKCVDVVSHPGCLSKAQWMGSTHHWLTDLLVCCCSALPLKSNMGKCALLQWVFIVCLTAVLSEAQSTNYACHNDWFASMLFTHESWSWESMGFKPTLTLTLTLFLFQPPQSRCLIWQLTQTKMCCQDKK